MSDNSTFINLLIGPEPDPPPDSTISITDPDLAKWVAANERQLRQFIDDYLTPHVILVSRFTRQRSARRSAVIALYLGLVLGALGQTLVNIAFTILFGGV